MRARLRKAAHQAEHRNPGWARLVSRIERAGLSLDRALSATVADSSCELRLRELAARLLRDAGGDTSAFVPLLTEFIAAGDVKNPELCSVIQSMNYGGGRLGRSEFETLHSTLRSGSSEQRYWVVNEIAFFTGYHDRRTVRHALIEVLEDPAAPRKSEVGRRSDWAGTHRTRRFAPASAPRKIPARRCGSGPSAPWAARRRVTVCLTLSIGMLWRPCWSERWRTMPLCRDGGRSAAKLRPSCNGFTEALRKTPDCRLRFKRF
jgi:hypothetical protein